MTYRNGPRVEITNLVKWSEDSKYATIGKDGKLAVGSVAADSTVRIKATYKNKAAYATVTIRK